MTQYQTFDVSSIPSFVLSTDFFSGFFVFTPSIAQNIINSHMYERQRPISHIRISQFSEAIKTESFAPVSTITFAGEKNSFKCVDGQHTLQAIIRSKTTLALPVVIIKGEQARLYSKIDRGKSRSLKDTLHAHDLATKVGLTQSTTLKVAVAIKVILSDYSIASNQRILISEKEIMQTVEEYKEEAFRCYEILRGLDRFRKFFAKIPLSIILSLYKNIPKNEQDKVDEFIYGCATDDALVRGDPRKLVYNMYKMYGRWGSDHRRVISPQEELAILLLSWSLFYQDKPHSNQFSNSQMNKHLEKSPNLAGTNIEFKSSRPILHSELEI